MKREIVSIEKIVNHRIREACDLELKNIKEKNGNIPNLTYTRLLWHGTNKTEPHFVYNSEKGFMIQYASAGYWGTGTYFAERACYSHFYAYNVKEHPGYRQLFLAEVIVGESVLLKPDRELRVPPVKQNRSGTTDLAVDRYDSVEGVTGGTRVWIVYENNRAYPTYLITYKGRSNTSPTSTTTASASTTTTTTTTTTKKT